MLCFSDQFTNPRMMINQNKVQIIIYLNINQQKVQFHHSMRSQIPNKMLQHLQYLRNLHQEGPRYGNVYLEDTALLSFLQQHPISRNKQFKKELIRLGDRLATIYLDAGRNAQQNDPKLQQFDSYGRRIDKLHLSEGWKALGRYSAEDGIVALAYEQDQFSLQQFQRFGQLIVVYMYQASSAFYGCPIAATDGAVFTFKDINRNQRPYLSDAFYHTTSRKQPWTSGQWMTQKKGGSDVSNTETIAIKTSGNHCYKLYGYKWFTSVTDCQMTIGLAKIIDQKAEITEQLLQKTKVSLFYIKVRGQDGLLNNLQIIRLKDKLGTNQLPTSQMLLKGTQAYLISEAGNGIKLISKMLLVTRLHNSATAVGMMRRMIALSRDYSSRRYVGRIQLSKMPLQVRVLAHMEVTHRANLIFYLQISELFSKLQANVVSQHQANMLRIMTPILKLFTGKQVLQVLTEGIQSFGGVGYIEGSMLPTILRDSQLLSIWEGTTNVLCYDFVRGILKKQNSINPFDSFLHTFQAFFQQIQNLSKESNKILSQTLISLTKSYKQLCKDLQFAIKQSFKNKQSQLRTFCFGIARIYIASLLEIHALKTKKQSDIEISSRWVKRGLYEPQKWGKKMDQKIGLDLDQFNKPYGVGDKDARGMLRHRF